jgi:erythromycin esterase-like protein
MEHTIVETVRRGIDPLIGAASDDDPLLTVIGDAAFVLLGEASHGTQEFYRHRAELTKRLIHEKGFTAVAVEADWPDAYRVNRYVRGQGNDRTALEALGGFTRFPRWMWRNAEVFRFVEWLRAYNDDQPRQGDKVGLYGLDLYSLHASIEAILRYLDGIDVEAADRARSRYACFDHYGEDVQAYGYSAGFGLGQSCEDEVVDQLKELRRHAEDYLRRDGFVAEDEFFFAEQNARLVANAERYYRTMFHGHVESWNLRDRHMAETLDSLASHFRRQGRPAKIVVWEHNSHLGDARATQMHQEGEFNVGQLVRERHGRGAVLIGFTTYSGTVTAASAWGKPAERKIVRPALADSYEAILHRVGTANFTLTWHKHAPVEEVLSKERLERAIGVVYLPETERVSHYFSACLPKQFDAIVHYDRTQAVVPLDHDPGWGESDAPDTFPSGV